MSDLENLVGEGKKYATEEDALASIAPAQDHIKNLEEQIANLSKDLEVKSSVEEEVRSMFDNLQNGGQPATSSGEETQTEEEPTQEPKKDVVPAGLTADQVEAMLAQRESVAQATANRETVIAGLKESGKTLKEMLDGTGLTEETFFTLASSAPTAALKIVKPEPAEGSKPNNDFTGSSNTFGLQSNDKNPPAMPDKINSGKALASHMADLIAHEAKNGGRTRYTY